MTVIDTEARPDEPLNEEVQTEPKFDKLGNREALEKALCGIVTGKQIGRAHV